MIYFIFIIFLIHSNFLIKIISIIKTCKDESIRYNASENNDSNDVCKICICGLNDRYQCKTYNNCNQLDCKNESDSHYLCCQKLNCQTYNYTTPLAQEYKENYEQNLNVVNWIIGVIGAIIILLHIIFIIYKC